MCPIAIPSHTAIAGNITGVPPAMATPIFTACAILSRFMCPGTISLYEHTIPTKGLSISSFVMPSALNRDLCGACCIPTLTLSLFIFFSFPITRVDSCTKQAVYVQYTTAERSRSFRPASVLRLTSFRQVPAGSNVRLWYI